MEYIPCELCGRPSCHTHHVYGGTANRKLSEKYKMTARLCLECHNRVHSDYQSTLVLKQRYQRIFEGEYGSAEFMRIFGKSYL